MRQYVSVSHNTSRGLIFAKPFEKCQNHSVTLYNRSVKSVAFKLKTTSPDLFYCAPFCGFLDAGQTAVVQIGIKTRRADEIITRSMHVRLHAFMFYAYPLNDGPECDNGSMSNKPYIPTENPVAFWCRPVLTRLLQATKMPICLVFGNEPGSSGKNGNAAGTYVKYNSSLGRSCDGDVSDGDGDDGRDRKVIPRDVGSWVLRYEELSTMPHSSAVTDQHTTKNVSNECVDNFHHSLPHLEYHWQPQSQQQPSIGSNDGSIYARISPVKVVVEHPSNESDSDPFDGDHNGKKFHYRKKSENVGDVREFI